MPVFSKHHKCPLPLPLRFLNKPQMTAPSRGLTSHVLLNSVGKHFMLAELRKQLQSIPKTKSRDFTVHFPDCETFALFIFTSRFLGKALQSMEYSWGLKSSIGTSPTSEPNFGWQAPLIFMTKKKKHCANIIFRSDAGPYSPMTLWCAIIQNKWL